MKTFILTLLLSCLIVSCNDHLDSINDNGQAVWIHILSIKGCDSFAEMDANVIGVDKRIKILVDKRNLGLFQSLIVAYKSNVTIIASLNRITKQRDFDCVKSPDFLITSIQGVKKLEVDPD